MRIGQSPAVPTGPGRSQPERCPGNIGESGPVRPAAIRSGFSRSSGQLTWRLRFPESLPDPKIRSRIPTGLPPDSADRMSRECDRACCGGKKILDSRRARSQNPQPCRRANDELARDIFRNTAAVPTRAGPAYGIGRPRERRGVCGRARGDLLTNPSMNPASPDRASAPGFLFLERQRVRGERVTD